MMGIRRYLHSFHVSIVMEQCTRNITKGFMGTNTKFPISVQHKKDRRQRLRFFLLNKQPTICDSL
jgi:hypothetical protein